MHGHALDFGAKSASHKMPIGFMARHIGARQQVRHTDRDGQSLAHVEQSKIILFGRRSVAHRTEFDEAVVGAGFAARPVMTHRERHNAAAAFDESRIANTLRVSGADLLGEVKTGIKRVRNVPA